MQLKVNGELKDFQQEAVNVKELLELLNIDPSGAGIAVAVAWEVIPRDQWDQYSLSNLAEIEIITARQGG